MYSESECYDYCIRLHKELQGVNKGDNDSHPAESRENKQVPSNAGRRAESRSDIKTTAKPRPCFKVKVMLLKPQGRYFSFFGKSWNKKRAFFFYNKI